MGVPKSFFLGGGRWGGGGEGRGERGLCSSLIPRVEVRGHTLSFCYAQAVPTYLVYRSLSSET